jgi:hypothetical protein
VNIGQPQHRAGNIAGASLQCLSSRGCGGTTRPGRSALQDENVIISLRVIQALKETGNDR